MVLLFTTKAMIQSRHKGGYNMSDQELQDVLELYRNADEDVRNRALMILRESQPHPESLDSPT